MKSFLDKARVAYEEGHPFISDAVYDSLVKEYGYDAFGMDEELLDIKVKHPFPLYSLQKVFDDEKSPLPEDQCTIKTPKLDGAAIALVYSNTVLVQAGTRGRDGITGEDITEKVYHIDSIPKTIYSTCVNVQIDGEIVCDKSIDNARNYAAGALRLKSIDEFKSRADKLDFVAYNIRHSLFPLYTEDMQFLIKNGFTTVINVPENKYREDGTVYRINSNKVYYNLGYTAKHPRGAYARKKSENVAVVPTKLLDVVWQVGRTGKVVPVAIFEDIYIEDAKINRATLHNPGFIEEMELEIGDKILVTRSGGIIPKVVGKI